MTDRSITKTPSTRKGQETRERIIRVAAHLMQENGVAGTSLDDVEREASTGRSQMYHYFSGKEDLVGAVIEHQAQSILDTPVAAAGLSSWAAWAHWRDETVANSSENECAGGCPLGSLASELADISEGARDRLSQSFHRWEESFYSGLIAMRAVGLIDKDADPRRLAITVMTSLEGGLLMSQTHRDKKYLEFALDSALAQIRSYAAPAHRFE